MSSARGEGARIGLEKRSGLHLVPKDTEVEDKGMLQEWEKEYKNQKKEYELLKTYFLYIKEKNSADEKKKDTVDLEEHLEEAKVSIDLMSDIIESTKKESTGSDNENYWITAKQYHKECAQFLKKAQKIIDEKFPQEKMDLENLLSEERARQQRNAISNIKERRNDRSIRLSSPNKPGTVKPLFRPPVPKIPNSVEETIVTPPLPTDDEEIILGDEDFEIIEDGNTIEPPPLPYQVPSADSLQETPRAPETESKKSEWPAPLFDSIKDKKITLPDGTEVDFDIPELPTFNVQTTTQEERKALGNRQVREDNPNTLIYGLTLKSGDRGGSKYSIGFTYDKNGQLTEYTLYEERPSLTRKNTPTHMSRQETKTGTPDQFKSILEKFLDYARERVVQERLPATDKIEPQKTREELERELDIMIAKAKSLTLDSMTKRETYEQHLIDMERINSEMKKLEKKFMDKFEEYTNAHPQNPKKYETNLYKNFEIGDENLDSPWFEDIDKKPPKTDEELEDEPDANPSRRLLKEKEVEPTKPGLFKRWGKNILLAMGITAGVAGVIKSGDKENPTPVDGQKSNISGPVEPKKGQGKVANYFESRRIVSTAEPRPEVRPKNPKPKAEVEPPKPKNPKPAKRPLFRTGLRDTGRDWTEKPREKLSRLGSSGELNPAVITPRSETETSRGDSLRLQRDISEKTDLFFDLLRDNQDPENIGKLKLLKGTLGETIFNIAQNAIFPGQKDELRTELEKATKNARGDLLSFITNVLRIGEKYKTSTADLQRASRFLAE